jgi:isochorismate synthase
MAAHAPWHDFGDASFNLPRWTYWTDGERGWLQVAGTRGRDALARDVASATASLAQAEFGAAETGSDGGADAEAPPYRIEPPDAAAWRRQIAHILAAIDAGQVRKVVAALCAKVAFERPPSVLHVLANLRRETGPVWRFAMARNGATFLGASPEILVRRRGEFVESEALAGTLAKANGNGSDLLASAKDRSEHEFVCDGIVDALAPLCSELHVPDAPAVRELKRLYHLATPIRGRLAADVHVLDLCERLHPTPATGGTPRERALDMILATEATPRGWYAAPVGWFDVHGDGEFIVALRSGLVTGHAAYVHAGAGIVAGSRADKELAEAELKQRVMLRALGLEPGSSDA